MKKLLYLFTFSFLSFQLSATHNMAGDISYIHVSGFTYKIIIRTFTNTVNTTADRCDLMVHFGDGDSAITPRINGASTFCPGTADGVMVNSCNGNVKYSIYEINHTYPGIGTYTISMNDPNRSPGICNIPNSVNQSFAIQAILVISPFLAGNNSVQYTAMPITCDTINKISYYNPLAVNADADSLVFELDTPLVVTGSYFFPTASSSFTINAGTGLVTWNTPTTLCVYVYQIKISEYKKLSGASNYYFIGSTTQEVWSTTIISTAINENNNKESAFIFPNPANESITIGYNKSLDSENKIEIKNVLGQTIKQINTNEINNSKNSVDINIQELPTGVYFIQFKIDNKLICKKFIKN